MALRGVSPVETWDYESPADPDKGTDQATRFKLRTLDVTTMAELYDGAMSLDGDKLKFNTNSMAIRAVRRGLAGWANFRDAQGNDIPFETVNRVQNGQPVAEVAEASLNRIPLELMKELADELKAKNIVTKAEAKNSARA